jgi:hypothetical protein
MKLTTHLKVVQKSTKCGFIHLHGVTVMIITFMMMFKHGVRQFQIAQLRNKTVPEIIIMLVTERLVSIK